MWLWVNPVGRLVRGHVRLVHDTVGLSDIWCAKVVAVLTRLSGDLGGKLLLGRRWDVKGRIHAQSSLGGTGSIGRVGGVVALLSCLLESVEVRHIDAVGGGRLCGLDGAFDIGRRVMRRDGHVGRGRGALITLQARALGVTLALLARWRAREAGEVWMFCHDLLRHGPETRKGAGCAESPRKL
jgi:hypothetical protein